MPPNLTPPHVPVLSLQTPVKLSLHTTQVLLIPEIPKYLVSVPVPVVFRYVNYLTPTVPWNVADWSLDWSRYNWSLDWSKYKDWSRRLVKI